MTPPIKSLQRKFIQIVLAAYIGIIGATVAAFFVSQKGIARQLGRDFAIQYVLKEKAGLSAPIKQELALALKMADTPILKEWALQETDPVLTKKAFDELESYRQHFRDGDYFFIVNRSLHYYFNDSTGIYTGKELRYTLNPKELSDQWYFSTIEKVHGYALNVNYDRAIRDTKIWMNVIVRNDHSVLGLCGTGLSLNSFIRDFIATRNEGVVPILLNRDGAIQAHPDPTLIDQSSISKQGNEHSTVFTLLGTDKDRQELSALLAGLLNPRSSNEAGALWIQTTQGERICAAAYIPELDWYALILYDYQRGIGLSRFLPVLLTTAFSLTLLTALLLLILRRIVIRPIAQLTQSTQLFSQGQKRAVLPVVSNDEIGVLTREFNAMTESIQSNTEKLETEVQRRTSELRSLLDNTGEGILSFGMDLLVDPGYSRECDAFFGPLIGGKRIDTLLFPDNPETAQLFRRAIEGALKTTDPYKKNLLINLLPTEINLGGRNVALRLRPLENNQVLLVLNDITYRKELETRLTDERKTLRFVVNALTNRRLFLDISEAFYRFLRSKPETLPIIEIYRQIHTFKGLFLQLDLLSTPAALQTCEDRLKILLNPQDAVEPDSVTQALDFHEVEESFNQDRSLLIRYLGNPFLSNEETYSLELKDLESLEALGKKILSSPQTIRDLQLEEEIRVIQRLRTTPIFELLHSLPVHTLELAGLRGKKLRPFRPEGPNVRVRKDRYEGLTLSLIHLFRNAVIHGIEEPEERRQKGKPEEGTVSLQIQYSDGSIILIIADDGAGLNLEKIETLAREKGLGITPLFSSTNPGTLDPALTNLLFAGGLSTRETADLYSGRGIGLGAVAQEVQRLGGIITLRTEKDRFTEIRIQIPDQEVFL
jgi:sensor histidine kinase YesM